MDKKDIFNNLTQDAQENSRFIESKTAIIAAIIGAILIYYLQGIEKAIKYYDSFSCINYWFFFLLMLCTGVNIFILFKIIFPLDNPKSKIPAQYNDFPNLYLSKTNLDIKSPDLCDFQESFTSDSKLENAMELEYVKTSYIRNKKLSLFKRLVIGLFFQVILFITHLIIYNSELIGLTPD